jgi:hypothetical protein
MVQKAPEHGVADRGFSVNQKSTARPRDREASASRAGTHLIQAGELAI